LKRFYLMVYTSCFLFFLSGFSILTQKSTESNQIGVYYRNFTNMPIRYIVDRGASGLVLKDKHTLLEDSFATWEAVNSCFVSFQNAGETSVDITVDSIQDPDSELLLIGDEKEEVIFDTDGSITEYFGLDMKTVLGAGIPIGHSFQTLSGEESPDTPFVGEIFDGFILINTSASSNEDSIEATVIHEIGHFIGLGHSTVNPFFLFGEDQNGDNRINLDEVDQSKIPTMYPFAFPDDRLGKTLEPDDIAAISTLYPEIDIEKQFGAISGTLKNRNKQGIFGGSVVALKLDTSKKNITAAISVMSGYYSGQGGMGEFLISGLPKGNYRIYTEPVRLETMVMDCENIGLMYSECETDFTCEFFSDLDCRTGYESAEILTVVPGQTQTNLTIIAGSRDPETSHSDITGAFPHLPYINGSPNGGFPDEKTKPEESGAESYESSDTPLSPDESNGESIHESIAESIDSEETGGMESPGATQDSGNIAESTLLSLEESPKRDPYYPDKKTGSNTETTCGCRYHNNQSGIQNISQITLFGIFLWLLLNRIKQRKQKE